MQIDRAQPIEEATRDAPAGFHVSGKTRPFRSINPALAWVLLHRSWLRLGPLAMIRKRDLDGMLVTMRSSGSHYLQWMLCMTMVECLGMPHPKHLNDPSLVGFMRAHPPRHGAPRVIRTHTEMPVPLYRALRRIVRFPRYAVLVRDLRETMVSYYEKDPPEHRSAKFSQFLRGRDNFTRLDHALFRQIRFLNSWARVREIAPDRTLVVRYDDLMAAPARELERVWTFFGFPAADPTVFQRAVELSTKDRMAQFEDGRERRVVRKDRRHPFLWYSDDDRAYLQNVVRRCLIDHYGYDYTRWATPGDSP